jgi:hypothetical protein
MTDSQCSYPGDRDEALVTYLYDDGDLDASVRAAFEAHVTTCVQCGEDLAALRGVRAQLGRWNPPEPSFAPVTSRRTSVVSRKWWREIPAWAQVAAALLFLGVSAGIANLDVRYDSTGLTVRTGWQQPSRDVRPGDAARNVAVATRSASSIGVASQASPAQENAPWRADLAALERQLKTEFHAAQLRGAPAAASSPSTRAAADAEIVRRVRALVDESEKRQQRELALRVAEVIHDVNAQRQADLVKVDRALSTVDRALGTVKNDLGVKVLQNQEQMNYIIRASQKQ